MCKLLLRVLIDLFCRILTTALFSDDRSGYKIHLNRVFYDERWSRNRCVTCMDWSPQFPELLVASYHNNEVCRPISRLSYLVSH